MSEFRLRIHTKAGDYRIGEFRAVPQYKEGSPQVASVLGISRDITDRIQTEQDLEESRNLLARIADTLPQVLYLYELATQRVGYINNRVLPVLGYRPEQIQGKDAATVQSLVHEDDR